ncbi:carbohydrate ABC transporter permease [Microbacterium invictum]|uniref:Raffinose/stachyose/melibiose transport system permease protein n=1 Tax=Microbacterium invictum TaxID=515415 RepID=A0AA40SRR2_9MICO|nr:carbohydrate ABC transporter permease [Microbacterium invictum]MBB4141246.1 raffinose/stachyose/melibiose transport system permease protein [Microbacterium invictum]
MSRTVTRHVTGVVAILVSAAVFLVPFAFIVMQSFKTGPDSASLEFNWPIDFVLWQNIVSVFQTRDYMLITAFVNSTILTVLSVTIMVVLSAMIGWVLARRSSRWNPLITFFILAGLIVPPAIVPTAWVMQSLGIFNTIFGLALIEVAYGMSFCVLLFRAFVSNIPRELDEAAAIDGAGPLRLFFRIGFPLLRSVIVTAIVVQSVAVFNDFANPLYFLPGEENATVQLTLFNFQSQFQTTWNLLFTDILLITIPPLVMYIFFNRQIVAGMTSGAIKG